MILLKFFLRAKVGASYYTYPLLILMINEINLPLSGEVPRRGGGGKKRSKRNLWQNVAGKGNRDDTQEESPPTPL